MKYFVFEQLHRYNIAATEVLRLTISSKGGPRIYRHSDIIIRLQYRSHVLLLPTSHNSTEYGAIDSHTHSAEHKSNKSR